jgi:TaqI-like C-terminal specificity domain
VKLENVTSRIFQGIKTSADKIYIVEERVREANRVKVYSREKDAEYWLEPNLLHPLIKGGDSRRYSLTRTNRLILFPYAQQGNGVTTLIPEATLQANYPLTWAYLKDNKRYLEDREDGKMRGSHWYGYVYPKALDVMPLPKIFTPDIAAHASFSLDESGEVFFTGGVAGGYGIFVSPEYSREYILGLLNSKLLEWFIRQSATQMRGGYYSFESRFIRNLPIRTISISDPADKARHDRIVELVQQMLSLYKRLAETRAPHDKTIIQQQINHTDQQIGRLVYELYGLTEEEIKIVEEQTSVSGVTEQFLENIPAITYN